MVPYTGGSINRESTAVLLCSSREQDGDGWKSMGGVPARTSRTLVSARRVAGATAKRARIGSVTSRYGMRQCGCDLGQMTGPFERMLVFLSLRSIFDLIISTHLPQDGHRCGWSPEETTEKWQVHVPSQGGDHLARRG